MSRLSLVIILLVACSIIYSATAVPVPFLFGVGAPITPYNAYAPGYGGYYPGSYYGSNGYRRPYERRYRYPHFYPPIAVLAG